MRNSEIGMLFVSVAMVIVAFVAKGICLEHIKHLELKDKRQIKHLEMQDKRHIALCEKLDCVNPKLMVQGHIRTKKKR